MGTFAPGVRALARAGGAGFGRGGAAALAIRFALARRRAFFAVFFDLALVERAARFVRFGRLDRLAVIGASP